MHTRTILVNGLPAPDAMPVTSSEVTDCPAPVDPSADVDVVRPVADCHVMAESAWWRVWVENEKATVECTRRGVAS